MSKPTEIFISYAWGGESERTVDELEAAFAARGLPIVRDKKELGYKGSIEAFEQRIGRGKAVILVISDKYLRSKHCMYELVAAAENCNLKARIFPVILADAKIYDAADRLDYIQHWDAQVAELNQKIKGVAVVSNLKGITDDLDLYTRIRANIDQLADLLSDMNTLTPEIHAASGYTTLIEAIELKLKIVKPRSMKRWQKRILLKNRTRLITQGVSIGSISDVSGGELNIAGRDQIDTGGGAYIGGNVNTGGGDFVGRDKIETHSTVDQRVQHIQNIYTAIEERQDTSSYEKADLKKAVEDIEAEDAKGDQAAPGFIEHRLCNMRKMAPDILEVVLATIGNPVAGFGLIAKKIAEKMQAEAG